MTELFSINRAASLLERDRQTLVRALRGVEPDGHATGQPRWKLPTIVAALSARSARSRSTNPELQERFDQLDALDAKLRAALTLQQRRKLARELFVMLADVDHLMRQDARRSGEDRELTSYRCDRHLQTVLWTLREPCGWSFEDILGEFNSATEASVA